jgi:asparagine synthase (glutamine-hydrolysing)
LGDYSPYETFRRVFHGSNVRKESYFDQMTHFDFKTLLPALFHVEDRVSMAHGLESRVPLLDHPLVEFAATIPSDVKFRNGEMKHVFKKALGSLLPDVIAERTDKMGFPVPLSEWSRNEARDFVRDVFLSDAAKDRGFVDNRAFVERMDREPRFSRTLWGLLSLELWQQTFHDRGAEFRRRIEQHEVNP